jgi:polyhydroxybutyrate depolymerase
MPYTVGSPASAALVPSAIAMQADHANPRATLLVYCLVPMRSVLFLAMGLATACSAPAAGPDTIAPPEKNPTEKDPTEVGGDRPATVYVPASYDGSKPYPLVVLLHGYSVSGLFQEIYMAFRPVAESRGFLYVYPDGTFDPDGKRFWNAGFGAAGVNDDAYLMGLVHEIAHNFSVDPKRIYFVGHSNGAFMSYVLACQHADEIAAIATLAGSMWTDAAKCTTKPVSLLHMHGTADTTIPDAGGTILGKSFVSAKDSALDWVAIDGCAPSADTSAAPIDVDAKVPGNETTIARWMGCSAGSGVEQWTMTGSEHIPLPLASDFAARVADFLLAHPKP